MPTDEWIKCPLMNKEDILCCSITKSCLTLQLLELQHARLPCPSLYPGVGSNSCPSSWWCHPYISSFVIPFFSCPQSLPMSGSFPMSWLFASGGQSIGVSASASVLPMNIWSWYPSWLTGFFSLPFKELSRVFSSTIIWKCTQFSLQSSSHIHTWLLGKAIALTIWISVDKIVSLLLNTFL